jgi:hypothetical protein
MKRFFFYGLRKVDGMFLTIFQALLAAFLREMDARLVIDHILPGNRLEKRGIYRFSQGTAHIEIVFSENIAPLQALPAKRTIFRDMPWMLS